MSDRFGGGGQASALSPSLSQLEGTSPRPLGRAVLHALLGCLAATLAWAAFTASMLASLTATGRFMFPNVLFEPPPTFKAGFPNEIQVGQVDP